MTKSLSERITEKVNGVLKHSAVTRNRAAFMAVKEEVRQALNDGWCRKLIWETLKEEGKINFEYQTFLRMTKKAGLDVQVKEDEKIEPKGKDETVTKNPIKASSALNGFNFDANAKKEDII
jgi:hypothetical protein